jgi:hypothetical protein
MVNYHFTSRAGLIDAVVRDIREVFVDQLRELPGYDRMSGLEAAMAKLDTYFPLPGEAGNASGPVSLLGNRS